MIEYIYDVIKATAGEDFTISAKAKNEDGTCVTSGCHLRLYNDKELITTIDGECINEVWGFRVPGELTKGLKGRYWYSICGANGGLNFKEPLYLV